jgi:hypothetical protein
MALKRKSTPGISRIDQPEKHNHGYFVRLYRWGKSYSAFFADKKHGGKATALAAAQRHHRELLAKFGRAKMTLQRRWILKSVGGNPAARPKNKAQPAANSPLVWVQCKGYRCLAYQNPAGKWINFYTGKVLADFVEVIR